MEKKLFAICALIALFIWSCNQEKADAENATEAKSQEMEIDIAGPEWAANNNLYEVNLRQYTREGTLAAFAEHLPRLKAMGVDILWFMPIHPISEVKRKGPLGSYYAPADYRAVNPKFGTLEEFKALVQRIHDMDMKVILDWVPNHTGWDHPWITEHPGWYTRDPQTDTIVHPSDRGNPTDWYDVAELNFDNPEMREAMIEAMLFWINEVGIDGFRFDSAHNQPLDFYKQATKALKKANQDIFLLAETEDAPYINEGGIDVSYGWAFHHLLNEIAQGKADATEVKAWYEEYRQTFERGYQIQFLTNHDENSWNGTIEERMGEAADAMGILAYTFDGMPLLYSGQEAGLDKRLKFFEKDEIEWGNLEKENYYKRLLELKHRNKALWNDTAGGIPQFIETSAPEDIVAFYREKDDHQVVVFVNASERPHQIEVPEGTPTGEFRSVFNGRAVDIKPGMTLRMNPWDYLVYSNI